MKYKYVENEKFKKEKLRLVTDEDGRLFVRKNVHINGALAEKLFALSCPYIVKLIEMGEDDDGEYVIEEYIDGSAASERSFTKKQAVKALKELCDALKALHAEKIVHRDIKPSNILVTEDGHIKLIDFDASRVEKTVKDRDTEILGTNGFAPPEQFGFSQTDSRSDIYAFGVTMELLLGENSAPFMGIIKKCKALDPGDRYDSISDVKTAIRFAELKRFAAFPVSAAVIAVFTVILSAAVSRQGLANDIENTYPEGGESVSASYSAAPSSVSSPQSEHSSGGSAQSSETPRSTAVTQSSSVPQSTAVAQSSSVPQSTSEPQSASVSESMSVPESSRPTQSMESGSPSAITPNGFDKFYTTIKNERGYYNDIGEYSFTDDPSLHGRWRTIGVVDAADLASFLDGRTEPVYIGDDTFVPWLLRVDLIADGSAAINALYTVNWTKGFLIHSIDSNRLVSEMFTVSIAGTRYLLIENKAGGYIKRGLVEGYFVLTPMDNMSPSDSSSESSVPPQNDFYITTQNENGEYVDSCDYVFTDAPGIRGKWETVGSIKAVLYDDWLRGKAAMRSPTDSWLKELDLMPGGVGAINNTMRDAEWTDGYLIRPNNGKVSAMSLVTVNGKEYLTIENKNGDYTRTGKVPSYFIMSRKSG